MLVGTCALCATKVAAPWGRSRPERLCAFCVCAFCVRLCLLVLVVVVVVVVGLEGVKNQNACLCGMGGGRSGLEDEQIAWEETKARVFGFVQSYFHIFSFCCAKGPVLI